MAMHRHEPPKEPSDPVAHWSAEIQRLTSELRRATTELVKASKNKGGR